MMITINFSLATFILFVKKKSSARKRHRRIVSKSIKKENKFINYFIFEFLYCHFTHKNILFFIYILTCIKVSAFLHSTSSIRLYYVLCVYTYNYIALPLAFLEFVRAICHHLILVIGCYWYMRV